MARARLPGGFAIALTVFHAISLLACILGIGAASYSAATYKKSAVGTIGTFVAAFWTIGVDVAEIAALLDKARQRIRRCPAKWLWLLELTTAIFCFGLPAASFLGYDMVEYERCRWHNSEEGKRIGCNEPEGSMNPAMMAGMAGVYLAATIHSILFVMTGVQWFVKRRRAKRAAAAAAAEKGPALPESEGVLAPPPRAVVRG